VKKLPNKLVELFMAQVNKLVVTWKAVRILGDMGKDFRLREGQPSFEPGKLFESGKEL
jgi:hypothetical protein